MTRYGSFDLETLLLGVIKSVVDFLLWMFRVHALSTVGMVFPIVNGSASARPANHAITDTAVIMDLRDRHLAKAKADPKSDPDAVKAINWHFALKDATIRKVEKARLAAERDRR